MTQIYQRYSSQQINRVYEIIELLKNTTDRCQNYYELFTNKQSNELTKIAFDNLPRTEMQKIIDQLTIFRQKFQFFEDWSIITWQIDRCRYRMAVAQNQQLQSRSKILQDTINKKIRNNFIVIVIRVILVIALAIMIDDLFMFLRYCDNQHCHIHSEFIADTYLAGGQLRDIIYQEIQCETQASFRLFYSSFDNQMLIRFFIALSPYFQLLHVVSLSLPFYRQVREGKQLKLMNNDLQREMENIKRNIQVGGGRLMKI